MREDIQNIDTTDDERRKKEIQESVRKKLEEKMPKIKIGDLDLDTSTLESIYHFHPYFSNCEELFPLTERKIEEILDPKERLSVMKDSVKVAQDIIKILFAEERKERETEDNILAGKCGVTAGVVYELMALSGVRSVIVHGTFPEQGHLYAHHWLYSSSDSILSESVPNLRDKLLLIDPTRGQFAQDKQSVININDDKRYIPFNLPPDADSAFIERSRDSFTKMNKSIWTKEELSRWSMILTEIYQQ